MFAGSGTIPWCATNQIVPGLANISFIVVACCAPVDKDLQTTQGSYTNCCPWQNNPAASPCCCACCMSPSLKMQNHPANERAVCIGRHVQHMTYCKAGLCKRPWAQIPLCPWQISLLQNSVCPARLQRYCPGQMNCLLYGEMQSLRIQIPGTISIVVVNQSSRSWLVVRPMTRTKTSIGECAPRGWGQMKKGERSQSRSGAPLPLKRRAF